MPSLDIPGFKLHLVPAYKNGGHGHCRYRVETTVKRSIKIKTSRVLTLTGLWLILASGCSFTHDSDKAADRPLRPAPFGKAVLLGKLENRDIKEASGMAASHVHPGMLWIANDGGDEPALYAVDMHGAHLGRMRIRNAQNVDWEDIATFRADGTPTLLIGDFGDNHSRRANSVLYFVHEPNIDEHPGQFDLSVDWFRRLRFEYEDGPRDCEAIAVDPVSNQILLLTKRTVPPVMYALPLGEEKVAPLMVAQRIAAVDNLRPPSTAPPVGNPRLAVLRSQPTAMDISANGSEIVILTYGDGYLYRRSAHLDWSQVFQISPEWIRMPPMRQAEALCFSQDGQSLFITSEQLPAPLYRLDRQPTLQRRATP